MRKERNKHTDFLLKLGLNIRYYRTLQGFTQKSLPHAAGSHRGMSQNLKIQIT